MKRRVFMGLGATSIAAGALHSSGAFSSLSAGRGIAVNAADDASALLGIKNANDEDEDPEFRNRTSYSMKIEFNPDDDSVTIDGEDPEKYSLELDPDESQTVEIDSDTSGLKTIDLTATLFDENAQSVGSIELEREFGVPQSEQLSLSGDFGGKGGSGKFEFTIKNDGDIQVQIKEVAINYATVNDNPDPVRITDELVDDTGGNNASGPIEVLNKDTKDLKSEDFEPFSDLIELNPGDENVFETDKLVDDDGNNAKYNKGGTLNITLKLNDGSKAPIDMEM